MRDGNGRRKREKVHTVARPTRNKNVMDRRAAGVVTGSAHTQNRNGIEMGSCVVPNYLLLSCVIPVTIRSWYPESCLLLDLERIIVANRNRRWLDGSGKILE